MDGGRFDLYFGLLRVGVVTQTSDDFLSLGGCITFDPSLANPRSAEVARLAKFIDLNRESTRLANLEDETGVPHGSETVDAVLEARYRDYVESEAWRLVGERGDERPILCPIFHEDGEIVWRWASGRG